MPNWHGANDRAVNDSQSQHARPTVSDVEKRRTDLTSLGPSSHDLSTVLSEDFAFVMSLVSELRSLENDRGCNGGMEGVVWDEAAGRPYRRWC